MRMLGLAMAWLIINLEYEASNCGILTALMAVLEGWVAGNGAVQRAPGRSSSFPLVLGGLEALVVTLSSFSRSNLLTADNVQKWSDDAWLFLSLVFFE